AGYACSFFFQAEDGIRDFHVTGVQTCALPISAGLWVVLGLCTGLIGHTLAVAVGLAAVFSASETAFLAVKLIGAAYLVYLAWGRSEERRVGKECRAGWLRWQ